MTLRVPSEAKVVLAGNETKTEGELRTYRTKGLKDGESWDDYKIIVTYKGQTKEKTIRLMAGDQLEMAIGFDDVQESKDSIASIN